jgi:hypothetical protein
VNIDIREASRSMVGGLASTNERPLAMSAHAWGACFEVELQQAQLGAAPQAIKASPLGPPPDAPQESSISEEQSLTEQQMWLGVTVPVPMALCPDNTGGDPQAVAAPQVALDSQPTARIVLPLPMEVAPTGTPGEAPSSEPRSLSPNPVTRDLPTLDSEVLFTSEPNHPAIEHPVSTIEEQLPTASFPDKVIPVGEDQTPAQQTVDEDPQTFDAHAPDAGKTTTFDRSSGVASFPHNEVWSNISLEGAQSSHHPRGAPVELRTELSEVVRQVRSMVTKHETRSTIQLEPSELGRLTLELVDAPQGQRAYVSAEDPAVMRFLERNVQLLESEARLQGVGQMSFSVGADVSGGLGRGDQRQSEADASFRKNVEWNTAPNAKSRSRRELDTNA